MPNTVKKLINTNPRHSGLMGLRLLERENTVTPLENPDLEPIPIQSHYLVNPSYWGNTTVNGEPVDITGYRDSNTGIARYLDGEYGYVNLPDNYGEWMMDGVTIYPERPRLKGVVRNYFDDAQLSKILGQPNVIAPIGVGDSEIQPIQFPTKAPEKYHGQDLDRFFANLLTFGTAGTEEYASQLFKDGDYLKGSIYAGLPFLVKGGPSGNLLRTGFWGYNLYNDVDDAAKMILDRNGWGYGKDVAKMVLDSGALLYDLTKFLLDAPPYLEDIARQRNNMGYWARTASDIIQHPLDMYRTVRKGTYVHDYPSLRRAVAESKLAVSEGADYARNYYLNALKVDMPEANITAKTNIPGAWGELIPGTTNFNYTFYRSPFSNLSRNTRDFKRVGGHEYTHLAEDYLNNRYFFPLLSVPVKPYYLPNVDHPIISTATVDDFMEGNIHGRSPEETWANYMGYNAGGGDPVMSFTDYNIKKEGIPPPRGFISDYEDYLKSLSGKALLKEGEIQLFNRRYGQKALGGTITNNSDSIILADNNNYILDFKGRQYGLPTVRYASGGHLFGDGGDGRTHLPRVGDSWRNTETDESGTVVGYAPDVPYMGDDGKLYPTTSPVVKYDSGETLFGVMPLYSLPGVTVAGNAGRVNHAAKDMEEQLIEPFKGLNMISPSQQFGAIVDAVQGDKNYFDSLYGGNSGFFTDKFAAEHPIITGIGNMAADIPTSIAALQALQKGVGFVSKLRPWMPKNYGSYYTSGNTTLNTARSGTEALSGSISLDRADSFNNWFSSIFNKFKKAPVVEDDATIIERITRENTPEKVWENYNSRKPYASNDHAYVEPQEATREYNRKVLNDALAEIRKRHPDASEEELGRILYEEQGVTPEDVLNANGFVWKEDVTNDILAASYNKNANKLHEAYTKTHEDNHTGFNFNSTEKTENLVKIGNKHYLGEKQGFRTNDLNTSSARENDLAEYLDADEVSSYMSELSTFFGNAGQQKLTPRQIEFAKNNIPLIKEKIGIDTGRRIAYILNRVIDPELFCEWLRNNSTGILGPIIGTVGYGLYDNFNSTNSDIHAYGGPLVQQANILKRGGTKRNIIPGNLPYYFSYDPEKDEYISDYYSDEEDAPDIKWYRSKLAKELKKTHRQVIDPDGGKIKYVPIDVYKAGSWKARGLPNPLYDDLQGGGFYLNPFENEIITGDGKIAVKAEGEFDEFGNLLYETDDGELYTDGSDEFSLGGNLFSLGGDDESYRVGRYAYNIHDVPSTTLPEVTVNGYAPIILDTYFPVASLDYPITGHSMNK